MSPADRQVRMRRRFVLVVVVLVLLAGCSGAGPVGSDAGGDTSAGEPDADVAEDGAGGGDDAGGGDGAETSVETVYSSSDGGGDFDARAKSQVRHRIKTATVELEVDSYDRSRDELVAEARAMGGYVDRETSDRHTRENDSWTTGTLVVRVPTEQYDEYLNTIESTGTVTHKETRTRDVTEEVVDLQARLENLRTQRDRLRSLYEDANETEDVLRIERRLSEVQGEIERTQGRLEVLEHQVAYSTVRIDLQEEPPERHTEPRAEWYETGVTAAFLESIDGVIVVARMFVVGVAYVLPYALAFALPVVGLYAGARRFG